MASYNRRGKQQGPRRDNHYQSNWRSGSPGIQQNGSPHLQRRRDYNIQPSQSSTPHEEYARFLIKEWQMIMKSVENDRKKDEGKVTVYAERTPNPDMQNFQPFDLDAFLAQMHQRQQLPMQ